MYFFKVYSPTGFLDRSKSKLKPYYKAAIFYDTYRSKFSRKTLWEASYITHWNDIKMDGSVNNDDLLDSAEKLVKQYALAKLVITSRIHAGLPCLGLRTPVIFVVPKEVESNSGTFNTSGLMAGLIELYRVMTLDNRRFTTDDSELKKYNRFSSDTVFENKHAWLHYASELEKRVTDFLKET